MKILLVAVIWMLLYFLVLWRLLYCYQVNRIKLPDGCKRLKTTVSWTDTFWSHFIVWELIESDHEDGAGVWDEIQKLNTSLEGRFGGFDVSDEPIMFLDIREQKEFAEYEDAALGRLADRAKNDSGHYYVLKYFKEAGSTVIITVFLIGMISTVFAGFATGFFIRHPLWNAGIFSRK